MQNHSNFFPCELHTTKMQKNLTWFMTHLFAFRAVCEKMLKFRGWHFSKQIWQKFVFLFSDWRPLHVSDITCHGFAFICHRIPYAKNIYSFTDASPGWGFFFCRWTGNSETFGNIHSTKIEKLYMNLIESELNVRRSTTNEIILIETVHGRQFFFFRRFKQSLQVGGSETSNSGRDVVESV